MKIIALQSVNDDFKNLLGELSSMAELSQFHDEQALILDLSQADAVLLDLDTDIKQREKFIKSIKKSPDRKPIIVLCNTLEGKKLQKHQASRSAADIYLTYPMELEVLKMMVEEAMNSAPKEPTQSFTLVIDGEEVDASDGLESLTEQDDSMSDDNQDEFDLDLGDEGGLDLSDSGDDQVIDDEDSAGELDLGDGAGDLSLGGADEEHQVEEVDNSIDLSMDEDNSSDDGEFSLSEDSDDDSFSLSEGEGDGEISLSDDAAEDDGFSLSGSDESDGDDDGEFSLSDDESEDKAPRAPSEGGGATHLGLTFEEESSEEKSDAIDDLSQIHFGEDAGTAVSQTKSHIVVQEPNQENDSEEPLGLSEDESTLGGLDLGDIGSGADVEEEPENTDFDKTRPILQNELSSILGDEVEDEDSEAKTTVARKDDDGGFEFGVEDSLGDGEENTLVAGGEAPEEDEDDFQTKLREIDQLLKENTAVTMANQLGEADDEEEEEPGLDINSDLTEMPGRPLDEDEIAAAIPKPQFSESLSQEHKDYISGHDGELVRLGETIKSLRLDREQLLKKVEELEKSQGNQSENLLTVQAQLDEKKIENSIMKKRYSQQIDDLNLRLELVSSKKAVLEEKNKQIETEFLKLRKEKKLDVNRVRSRERELEDKLELLRKDAEIQVRNRDQKILELKRRIDALEFDIENAHLKERQSLSDQAVLEDKMTKVISTLRSAIGQFEDDGGMAERKKAVKKNLDV